MSFDDTYNPTDDPAWDESPDDWPWESIDAVHVTRDSDGWEVSVEIDGELFDVLDGIDDETAQDLIWDDIYWLAMEHDADFDKEVEYA